VTHAEVGATPIRITAVMTHPIQYMSPWFRSITSERRDLELTVLYGAVPSPEQQGVGFGRAFTWDVPLTDGHRAVICADAAGMRFDSNSFFGLDVPDIGRRIEATTPDVVLLPGWHAAMQVRTLRECRRAGIPVLYRGDSTLVSGRRGLVRPIWSLKTRLMLRQFSGYLSVGRCATDYLRHFGVPESRIDRSPHCVDNAAFASAAERLRVPAHRESLRAAIGARAGDLVVLFAGKFHEQKRPLDAVRAAAAAGSNIVLLMAGDGVLADAARAEAARLGVRLAWKGFLNQSQVPEAFAAADVLLVPSAWETWGLIVNEALASGVPCIVTEGVASAPDLVDADVNGWVVPVGDTTAMAAAIRALGTRLEQGESFRDACQRAAHRCSFDVATEGLVCGARRVTTPDREVRRVV
jgi:glycosyltransferase involved in cell wall biosynthesis